jgi:hypothetical protein
MKLTNRLSLAVPLLVLAACADNMASIEVKHVCAPPETASACSFSGTCDAVSLSPFFFDVGAGAPRMWMFVEVANQLTSNAADGNLNTNDAYLQEATVSYEGGGIELADANYRMLQMVEADTTQVVSVYPLPDTAATELSAFTITGIVDIVAKVRLKGAYVGGQSFETGEYEIPIRVCNNCLGTVGCPTAGDQLFACPPGAVTAGGQLAQLPASIECVTP